MQNSMYFDIVFDFQIKLIDFTGKSQLILPDFTTTYIFLETWQFCWKPHYANIGLDLYTQLMDSSANKSKLSNS